MRSIKTKQSYFFFFSFSVLYNRQVYYNVIWRLHVKWATSTTTRCVHIQLIKQGGQKIQLFMLIRHALTRDCRITATDASGKRKTRKTRGASCATENT